jgi:hypothetical protein
MLKHWNLKDLACCSIAEIRLIALNVTTPLFPLSENNWAAYGPSRTSAKGKVTSAPDVEAVVPSSA